jgi:hypothetical protein
MSTKGAKRKLAVNLIDGIKQEDYGIASGLLQTHLPAILGHCLDLVTGVQALAFDIVCIALEQGLVHPLLCMPTLIAMQAFPRASLTAKAAAVHGRMVEKYPSFIHSRNLDGLRLLHQAHVRLTGAVTGSTGQHRADAECLASFFNLIRSRRALKYETFLSILDCFELKEEQESKATPKLVAVLSPCTPGPSREGAKSLTDPIPTPSVRSAYSSPSRILSVRAHLTPETPSRFSHAEPRPRPSSAPS